MSKPLVIILSISNFEPILFIFITDHVFSSLMLNLFSFLFDIFKTKMWQSLVIILSMLNFVPLLFIFITEDVFCIY